MIIAHGPLGYLVARYSRRWWQQTLTVTQRRVVYLAAASGGIFPDVDLFYFYLVDSSLSHRQLLTHSLILYTLFLILAVLLVRLLPKRRFWWLVGIVFLLGAISHVFADMLVGMVALFNPLSTELYGLISIPWYRDSWFMRYSLITNFTSEFIIMMIAAGTLVRMRQRSWWFITGIATVLVSLILWWLSLHNYKPDGYFYYSDQDQDGLLNVYDLDIDGDGKTNVVDLDIDGDGLDNSLELYLQLFAADGALFDYSYGHLIEVPLRFGLVNPTVLVDRVFANIGVFFGEEMTTDYQLHPEGYVNPPTDHTFSETVANWQVWLAHTQQLLPADSPRQEYDIIFFQSGYAALFTRDVRVSNGVVLDVHPSHPYSQYLPLDQVINREGPIIAIGRFAALQRPLPSDYSIIID